MTIRFCALTALLALSAATALTGCGGSQAPAGPTGAVGPMGATGPTGPASELVSSKFSCTTTSGGFTFQYSGAIFNSGDAWVECSVADSATQSTGTQVYQAGSAGATTFACAATLDDSRTPSGGTWNFSVSGVTQQATYSDPKNLLDGTTVKFTPAECTTTP